MKLNKFEIRRQLLHIVIGLILIVLIIKNIFTPKVIFILILISALFSILSTKFDIPILSWVLRKFDRKEHQRFPGRGFIFFLAGSLLVLKLFDLNIALASIMILTLGDSFAHLFGTHLNRLKYPLNGSRSLDGIIIGIITGFLGALIFVPFLQAFFASLIAMFVEATELKMSDSPVDDNIIVPLVAATVIYLIQTNFAVFY